MSEEESIGIGLLKKSLQHRTTRLEGLLEEEADYKERLEDTAAQIVGTRADIQGIQEAIDKLSNG